MVEFKDEEMGGFWDAFKFWLFRRKLIATKTKNLWEANIDKFYLETVQREYLEYNDTEDRKLLQVEGFKPEQDRDRIKIAEIEQKIATGKAVKANHRRNENFRQDIKVYIQMLKEWKPNKV